MVRRISVASSQVENAGGDDAVGPQILNIDVYDIVVISAFGGVVQKHAARKGVGPQSEVLVHPWFLFLLTVPMLVGQTSTLVFLNLDYQFTKPVQVDSGHPEKDELLHVMKLMMVLIVQLTMFSKILGSLRLLVFLLTPRTWSDIQRRRPDKIKARWLDSWFGEGTVNSWMQQLFDSPLWVAPPAVLAALLHGLVDYNICMDSVSIILSADKMKEAVYDSLAITFLADLPGQWWTVVSLIFHMGAREPPFFRRRKTAASNEAGGDGWSWCSWLPAAGTVRTVFTSLIMLAICARQASVVGMAVQTNILPVSRDICSWWRFNTNQGGVRVSKALWLFTESWLLVASPARAISRAADPGHGDPPGFCTEDYHLLRLSDVTALPSIHPIRTCQLACIALFVFAAQVYYHCNGNIKEWLYVEGGEAGGDDGDAEEQPRQPQGNGGYTALQMAETSREPLIEGPADRGAPQQKDHLLKGLESQLEQERQQRLSLEKRVQVQQDEEREAREALKRTVQDLQARLRTLEERPPPKRRLFP